MINHYTKTEIKELRKQFDMAWDKHFQYQETSKIIAIKNHHTQMLKVYDNLIKCLDEVK